MGGGGGGLKSPPLNFNPEGGRGDQGIVPSKRIQIPEYGIRSPESRIFHSLAGSNWLSGIGFFPFFVCCHVSVSLTFSSCGKREK